ncbi:low affinity vacuolar monovalent cation/H(+) antiporter isoform X2 [Electrophorus electricus]|uniref:low affinity vacuolar monovalent cation/H(+) antiporter isoform X2 n=1 Tax=Electrophorus electricus TaxID=8005 RepID=UPI0015D001D1|nr:low affinity vacuolar monovalent cation/H(+) antiporter isoform X2 [Electrophorus electricus]
MSADTETRRRLTSAGSDNQDPLWDKDGVRGYAGDSGSCYEQDHLHLNIPDSQQHLPFGPQKCSPYIPKRKCTGSSSHTADELWEEVPCKTTISAENEVEAQKLANNYKFGFRKWKSHVTERPFQDRSEIVKELYSELNVIKPNTGSLFTCGNVLYVVLFGWWISLVYLLTSMLMFMTIIGIPHGKLCLRLAGYFLWPFGKAIQKASSSLSSFSVILHSDARLANRDEGNATSALLLPTSVGDTVEEPCRPLQQRSWGQASVCVWMLLGYPPLAAAHCVLCLISWLLVFTIPVAKLSFRTLGSILLMAPEQVHICSSTSGEREDGTILCCYHAVNIYYYKYTVDGINVFAVNLLPLVIVSLIIGYVDQGNHFVSSEVKFATAISSIIPLSYYIGMGIASISAQSNFAVGAVVNATFGSITELTFYITALLRGRRLGNKCLEEIVKAALTGTLLGCILFIPGICMIIGGLKHREQRFNSRSAGVSCSLLFISIGGVFAPTLFSKAYGNLVCEDCSNSSENNGSNGTFTCRNCHYDLSENNYSLFHSHIGPLVYTVSVLLPVSYIIGLLFTLKTHSHIYDIHVGEEHALGHLGPVVHWSRWRALLILIVATVLMSACSDLITEHIQPILTHPGISQYFIGVTVLAMVPEIPELVNGIQFALQNNISLSLEVGSCIAIQVCMIQIPILILFNAVYDVGFVLIFSDLHLWASIFSVILVNYIFMDGKSDYFQGTALVVVYLILLALYFFAPSPAGC